jgi:gliding motility-associated-like protein
LNSGTQNPVTVEWQDGSTGNSYLVSGAGMYSLIATNECGSTEDHIFIATLPLPAAFSLGPDTTICIGGSILLHAPATGDEFVWQDGSTGSTYLADQAQTYSLEVSNACGTTADQVNVALNTDIPEFNLPSPVIICPGVPFMLDAEQDFTATYLWSTGEVTPSILISAPGSYLVEVVSRCLSGSAQVEVLTVEECDDHDIFIPNVFSPNDDQVNDFFKPAFGGDIELKKIDGSIFDRWGNKLYYSDSTTFEWNGHYKDQPVMPGVYVYRFIISYTEAGEFKEDVRIGDVTVLR